MKYISLVSMWVVLIQGQLLCQVQSNIETWAQQLESNIDTTSFRTHLYKLAKEPHRAGTEANERVADYIGETMSQAGFKVKKYPYDIYMPKSPGKAQATIITPHRQPLSNQEDILLEDEYSNHENLDIGWNAYSGSGRVTGEVVYVNYGKKEDFELLEIMGISIEGKIAIARYGGNFRGFKAKFAAEAGAIGLIMYTDPKDAGYVRGLPYPEGRYYNSSTIQRGSVLTLPFTGDPLTPFEPALPLDQTDSPERLAIDSVDFHEIPVLPMSYGSAEQILKEMKGQVVPNSWQGGLPFTYRIIGGPQLTVELDVDQPKDFVRINNVIGMLEGSKYPDEWIILGCHYDAWGYGTTDPNSGTAMLLSLAETLGKINKSGKGIQRSILIGHWDAEEHGILGSTEWVEEMRKELNAKTIAYINADAASSGTRFSAAASPSLKPIIHEAAKYTSYMNSPKTIWEHWLENQSKPQDSSPSIGNLGGGSDHLGFYSHIGIPAMAASMSGSTLYHSNYDDLHWFHKFGDSTYQNGITLAKLVGLVTLQLSEKPTIPLNMETYGLDLVNHIKDLAKMDAPDNINEGGWSDLVVQAVAIATLGQRIDEALSDYKGKYPSKINQLLIQAERQLILDGGMPFGEWYQSIYACSDPYSGYAAWMLPGLRYYLVNNETEKLTIALEEHEKVLEKLYKHLVEIQELLKQ
ncbi:M28 family peptidase [Membranihabitans marinus]|uniref:M28 family peptidase n=1 Tax=Membranihabitans marinus TaxID=1227546 RepID=UPI001F259A17|nr:M28 family peptidase [Membranihabitans marinus]